MPDRFSPSSFSLLLLLFVCGCSPQPAQPRVIILGFDGLDFSLSRELMEGGRLPNLSRLAAQGHFSPLATSMPPQSPVAWSTFITGLDPGSHGIFDFVHRDPATMVPYLSTTRTKEGDRKLTIGKWQLPLSAGRVQLLRQGQPFWEALEGEHIETSIIRMPANFPPSGTATRELSGMGTPDVLGTYGVFSFYTSDPRSFAAVPLNGGTVQRVNAAGGTVHATLQGPRQPYLRDPEDMSVSFSVLIDTTHTFAKIVVGDEERLLRVGEWSDWVPVAFPMQPWQTLNAECRFYLKQISPTFELYASPLNLDPMSPAAPISAPAHFAGDLAEATGRFYTQGMPEDTKALKTGILSTAEFLEQARIAQAESLRQYRYMLDGFEHGLLFYYFGNVDQVSHMLWRARDPGHPAYKAELDAPYAHVIEDLYVDMDAIVGETLEHLGPDDLLVVMSDHGFSSWRRTFNLNTWLRNEGYVARAARSGPSVLGQIELSRSRAYGLGLNGLYVNVRGREAFGTVAPEERESLITELREKLLRVVDPATGLPAITDVYRPVEPHNGRHAPIAPDLIIGYAKGTRVSDESSLGELPPVVMSDNTSAWSGDHCMDPEGVPGILLTSRRLKGAVSSLRTLAPAILGELGVDRFPSTVAR